MTVQAPAAKKLHGQPPPPHVSQPTRPPPPVPALDEPMKIELSPEVMLFDALGNPSTRVADHKIACCHGHRSQVGALFTLQGGGPSANKDPNALFEETYEKGDLEFSLDHRAHVGKGYMVDIKVWTWVPEMGLPPYGNSKEAVNDVSHTGSFRYTMSCQTIDTENQEVMKAFDPNFEGERNAVSMLIPHTIMLEVEGKVCNEDPDKATVSRNWSANYYVWDRRRQLMRNAKYMVIDRHHITHQTHCGAHFECQWTVPHNAPGVERSVALRRNENGQFVAGSSPLTVAEEVLFKDKQVSLTSAATFIMYRAMASRCRVGYIQADEECIVLAPIKDLAARALVYKKLKEMKLLTLTQAPLTVRENNVAAANIIKQKLHPVTASVVIETPNGDASITTCAESRNQLDYCDSARPCSNIVELPTIGQPSQESPFPTGLRAQKRIRFAEVVGNAEEAYDDHALPWHKVTNLQKRAYDPETHLSYHIHGMPSLKSKLMLKDLVERGEATVQVNPLVADFENSEPPMTTNAPNQDINNEQDALDGDIPDDVIKRVRTPAKKVLEPSYREAGIYDVGEQSAAMLHTPRRWRRKWLFMAEILDELHPLENGVMAMCRIPQIWGKLRATGPSPSRSFSGAEPELSLSPRPARNGPR